MSDLNYYAAPPAAGRPHRAGLIAWGVVAIVAGSALVLSGVATVAVVAVMTGSRGSADPRAIGPPALNLVLAGGMGGALIWLGVGSCRGRRWVRPLVVAGGSVAVVSGAVSIVPVGLLVVSTLNDPAAARPQLPPGVAVGMAVGGLLFSALVLIGLPAVVVAWFRRPSVADTLAGLDPATRWTDAVPVPALAWVVTCVWFGGGMAASTGAGVWFWFRTTVTGPATLAAAGLGLAVVAAGYGCYRRSALAWAASVGLFALLAVSAATFAVAGDTGEYRRQMAARTAAVTRSFTPGATSRPTPTPLAFGGRVNPEIAPALLYGLAVAYGLWVRPQVVERGAEPAKRG